MHFSLFGCCQGALKFATASAITASSSHGSAKNLHCDFSARPGTGAWRALSEEVAATHPPVAMLPVRRLLSEKLVVCDANCDFSARPGTGASPHPAFPILQAVVLARRIHNAIGHLGIILLEAQLAATPKPVME